ncbi:unnamed protein product [Lymnaea stagnalis]|uniref:Leishmanolysin-like peptidase n=1 Tax=Lymnaea stagnalis TaxID=6523 RepID=A0AAV2H145_LYMST
MSLIKGLNIIFTWTTFLILFEPYHDITESCFYDRQTPNQNVFDKQLTEVWQSYSRNQRRLKRHSKIVFNPIRISPIYSFDQQLLSEEREALQNVIERAVRKINALFSVVSVEGPLLLPRSSCPAIFISGINKGKCARIPKGYTGEFCMDNFKIPNTHLQGFVIYNRTSPDPINVYKDGPGLANADFVLYVTSQTTALCNPYKTSALAYAASCQLQGEGRPVAGQVNFCPRTVKSQKFDEELLYKTAVHELFHALGFSNKLFDKFQKCNEYGECQAWPQPMLQLSDGVMRLMTDAVIREMKQHFNCTTRPDFGGPIEITNEKPSSHWDSMFMHSSVMGSKEQKPYQTLIDPITLAVFEDSGWYKVNYSHADTFIWGQDQGCSFGLKGFCESQAGFCIGSHTGCHHLRLSKARCNAPDTSTCGVFATDQKPCFISSNNSSSFDEEIFSDSSRCFLSTLAVAENVYPEQGMQTQEESGRCYERKCQQDAFFIRVRGGDWILCQPGSYVQVPNYEGAVQCPSHQVICSEFIYPEPSKADVVPSPITSTNRPAVAPAPSLSLCSQAICPQEPEKTGYNAAEVVHRFCSLVLGNILFTLKLFFS